MFNSCGNRGNILGRGIVLPFEVLGKWMGRYAMWQLDLANDLFIAKGGTLGKLKICYDVESEIWEYMPDEKDDTDDDQYTCDEIVVSDEDSDSDLEPFTLKMRSCVCIYVKKRHVIVCATGLCVCSGSSAYSILSQFGCLQNSLKL